jgi:hypothetical protein
VLLHNYQLSQIRVILFSILATAGYGIIFTGFVALVHILAIAVVDYFNRTRDD